MGDQLTRGAQSAEHSESLPAEYDIDLMTLWGLAAAAAELSLSVQPWGPRYPPLEHSFAAEIAAGKQSREISRIPRIFEPLPDLEKVRQLSTLSKGRASNG